MNPTQRFYLLAVLAVASQLATPQMAVAQVLNDCGVFRDAEQVEVTFRMVGGGSWDQGGGRVITERDTFTGTIVFGRSSPDDECAIGVERVGPYTLDHKYDVVEPDGRRETVVINETVNAPQATLSGGVGRLGGIWNLVPVGVFQATETRVDVDPPRTIVTPVQNLPWGPVDAIVPNLPIPRTAGPITVELRPEPVAVGTDTRRWVAEISVNPKKRPPVWIDPCWIYFASTIGCEQQSLGEAVPLTGLPFQLHYQSDRFDPAAPSGWSPRELSVAGWSLAIHHSWDATNDVLYVGDGTRRSGPTVRAVPGGPAHPPGSVLIVSSNGGEVFLFDASGRHLKTFDTMTGAMRYEFGYSPSGSLVSIRNPFSRTITIERDAADRALAIVAPGGERTTFDVNAGGRLTRVVNPAAGAYRFQYSTQGWLTSFTDPLDRTSRYTYDSAGRLVSDESPGRAVNLTRSEQNGITTVTVDDGGVRSSHAFARVAGGTERSMTFPDGTKTATETSGTVGTITMRDGATMRVTRADDPLLGTSDALETLEFVSQNGITRSATSMAAVEPAADGNPLTPSSRTRYTTVDDHLFRALYRSEDRTAVLTTPQGRSITSQYNANGQPVRLSRSGFAPVTLTYDALGRLSELRSGDGGAERRARLEYDERGRLRSMTDPAGRPRRFAYDPLGRVSVITFGGTEERVGYDALGRVTSIQPPGRSPHRVLYTPAGDVAAYEPPALGATAGRATTYTYTPARTLASTTRLDGMAVSVVRDRAGRITSATLPTGTLRIGRDAGTGHVSSVTSPSGLNKVFTRDAALVTGIAYSGPVTGRVEYRYGPSARLSGVSVSGGAEYAYTYDDDGLLTGAGDQTFARDPQSGLLKTTAIGSITAEWTYNAFGESISHTERSGAGVVFRSEYTRDALGRIAGKTETIGSDVVVETYEYDAAGRLAKVTRGGQEVARYEYDANGNRTRTVDARGTLAATFDEQDRQLTLGTTTYAYSPNGDLLSRTSGSATTSFVFDALSELRSARTAAARTIEYIADEDGLRVARSVDGRISDAFLYHPDGAPLAWLDGAGAVRATFIYGRRAYVPDSMIKDGVAYRIVTDAIGSVRLVADAATGAIAQRIDYDAFGRVVRDSSPGFQPFGFAGGLPDADTGLVRIGARDYDPQTGRWTSKDPLFFAGGATNLYEYVGNDPINRADPTGLWGGTLEVSLGLIQFGVTYASEVGVSGSVQVGLGSPGVNVSGGGKVFVPANANESFLSRDAKVTLEAKAGYSVGDVSSLSFGLTSEELQDKYGYYCGEFGKPVPKVEACLFGYCLDNTGEMKSEVGKAAKIIRKKSETKFEAGVEGSAKVEFLVYKL